MKMRKAIKKIAALGVGATMLGATVLGASAYTLADYPNMFIENGQFNGLLVIGANADSIDTYGVVNIVTALQAAAVTKTEVCGTSTSSKTTVTGEAVQIKKTGNDLNIGEDLQDMKSSLDDTDLPNILASGTYKESEGNTDNDVTYDQTLYLKDGTGTVVYTEDKDGADEAGVYLKFDKNEDIYNYVLDFDSDVEYDGDDTSDFEGTTINIQGKDYTITDVTYDTDNSIKKMKLMAGDAVMWMSQDETVTKTIDGVEHEITMLDVTENENSCGFKVDGTTVWVDVDDTESVGGVTLGVTDAKAVHNVNYDSDICKVYIGAEELELEDGKEIKYAGEDIDGSEITFNDDVSGSTEVWEGFNISYDPSDDIYLAPGDEWVDPVFGNFKIIMGNVVATTEKIKFDAASSDGTLTFTNYDNKEVELPFTYDEGTNSVFYLGDTDDPTNNPDEMIYLEGQTCDGNGDLTDCAGARFLVVTDGDVAHLIEITSIDDPSSSTPQMDFKDLTYGTTTQDKDYTNGANTFTLGSSVGDIQLTLDTSAGTIEFTDIDDGDMKTKYEGIITINVSTSNDRLYNFVFAENTENSDEDAQISIVPDEDTDQEDIEYDAPVDLTNDLSSSIKKSETDDKTYMYYTDYGTIVEYDSDNKDDITITHPADELYVEAFIAETGAKSTTTSASGDGDNCVVSETVNQIPDTVNKFDNEITDYKAYNIIAVGGPCANAVSAAFLGNPEVCTEGFESGKAIIQLFDWGNGKYGLLVAGGDGKDTLLASKIMQNYDKYDLSGMKMVATTVSEDQLSVTPVSS